jgi:uncharacterized protein DUF1761
MAGADVSYIAVLLVGIAAQVLGFAWYGPLFSKPWMRLRGYTKEDAQDTSGMGAMYALAFVISILIAIGLSYVVDWAQAWTVWQCVVVAAAMWLVFQATVVANSIIFSKTQSVALWTIEAGYYLVLMVVAGIIIGLFQPEVAQPTITIIE